MLPSHIRSLLKENNLSPSSSPTTSSVVTQAHPSPLPVTVANVKNSPKAYLPLKLSNLSITNSSVTTPLLYSPFSVETAVSQSLQFKEDNELIENLDVQKKTTENSAVFFRKCPRCIC